MVISGGWNSGDDGVLRPVLAAEILAPGGSWLEVPFLVDTGADRTVLSGTVAAALGLPPQGAHSQLAGVGGTADAVTLATKLRLTAEDRVRMVLEGSFAALTDPAALDMSVLGRDVLNLFAVIVDRPRDAVCLLGQRHGYTIVAA